MRADGNNVDIDAEGGRLAAAQIYYQGVAQLMQGQFAALKYVIAGEISNSWASWNRSPSARPA